MGVTVVWLCPQGWRQQGLRAVSEGTATRGLCRQKDLCCVLLCCEQWACRAQGALHRAVPWELGKEFGFIGGKKGKR